MDSSAVRCTATQSKLEQKHCNTMQHIAAHCGTLQHTATHCNTLQHITAHCNTACTHMRDMPHSYVGHASIIRGTCFGHHTATHYNALPRTATHCNTLQHTARLRALKRGTRLVYLKDMPHSYAGNAAFRSGTCLIRMWDK